MKREKSTVPKPNPCRIPRQTQKKNDFCDFDKPHKRAYQKGKIESNEQSKKRDQPKSICGKERGVRRSRKLLRNQ